MKRLVVNSAILAVLLVTSTAFAVQFSYLDPSYTQEIYTGPLVGGPGMAWTASGNLLTINSSNIIEYSPTQNNIHQGTNIHDVIATHTISGLVNNGAGMVKGTDGLLYINTTFGLQRVDPTNWAAPAVTLAGTVGGGGGYGITLLSNGKIAYVAGGGTNDVYVYDPSGGTNTWIYSAAGLIDDIEGGQSGVIALAGQALNQLVVISNSGALINTLNTVHYPDGIAFGDGVTNTSIFTNNNDGTITRYTFGPGYSGTPTATDIASGSGAYGDLASVGPDCAFYVSQFENGNYHGATAGIGTHWDNGVTNAEPSIIRIALKSGECGFNYIETVPEPGSIFGISAGLVGLVGLIRRKK
jgi:hypothetical protein